MIRAGMIAVSRPGETRVRRFGQPPGLADRLVARGRYGHSTFLLMGRLHYRAPHLAWLAGQIGQSDSAACADNDAALAAALHHLGGITALEQLEGEFVLLGYDESARSLIALRSPLGGYPLFWARSRELLAVSTSIRPLLDVVPYPELDPEYTADYLAFPFPALSELPKERTPYRGVQRLLPGHLFEGGVERPRAMPRRYWHWSGRVETVSAGSLEEAGLMVRERLRAAVRERLSPDARTACHFSGGMDSTGLALLAEPMLAAREQTLEALSYVYSDDSILGQERGYIELALSGRRALRHHAIAADGLLRWDGHATVPPLDEPAAGVVFFRQDDVLAAAAQRAGADTILSGDGADHLFAHPAAIQAAELMRKGRLRKALRLLEAHAAETSRSTSDMMRSAFRNLLPFLRRPRRPPFGELRDGDVPPWLDRRYVRLQRIAERTAALDVGYARGRPFSATDMESFCGEWSHWHVCTPRGIVLTRPFFDPRVVGLALGLPAWLHEKAHPMKPVLAAAMTGVLPGGIIHRQRKAHFNLLVTGYGRHRDWLERLISETPIPEGIIDRQVLLDCVQHVALDVFGDAIGVGRLDLVLSWLVWLSRRAEWAAQQVTYVGADLTWTTPS